MPFLAPYVAAKHAVVGICRSLANELAGHYIRVNTVHPAGVDTPMVAGLETLEPFLSRNPELGAIFANGLPVEALDPRDVSNAVLWLASEEARYVTGAALTVDAGTPSADRLSSAESPVQQVSGARDVKGVQLGHLLLNDGREQHGRCSPQSLRRDRHAGHDRVQERIGEVSRFQRWHKPTWPDARGLRQIRMFTRSEPMHKHTAWPPACSAVVGFCQRFGKLL